MAHQSLKSSLSHQLLNDSSEQTVTRFMLQVKAADLGQELLAAWLDLWVLLILPNVFI